MKTRIFVNSGALGLLLWSVACGSDDTPNGSSGGATSVGGSAGASMGGSTSTGGATGTGGTSGGSGGTGGGAGAGVTGGASTGGMAGASGSSAEGGTSSGGTSGTNPGGAGGSDAGTGGATGTATFTVKSELASDQDQAAPTTVGIVTWSADVTNITAAYIDFGLTTSYGMRAPVDLAEMDYRTLLLGMKPMSMYHFRITATAGGTNYASNDYTITTGAPPSGLPVPMFDERNAAGRKRGFIIASYWRGSGTAYPFILDADGDLVWWRSGGPSGGIARAVMSADGKNMWMITANNSGGAVQRVSMDGLDAQTYSNRVGSHDITPVTGATMAFLEYGESDCDSIYEIDPSGNATEIWESQGVVSASGCHGNALRYSAKENVYTFSDVRQDIFVISRAGMLQWRLSERTMGGNSAWGGTQHGHHLLDNSILVFANVGGGNMASDFVEYSLEGQQLARYTGGGFSANLGDVQRLPGGNTLITYSNDGHMQEIDAQRNVVLQIDASSSFGYSLWRETLYGPPPDISM